MTARLVRHTTPKPYDHVTYCPVCGTELHLIRNFRYQTFIPFPQIELLIKQHLRERHPIRYWLWRRIGKPLTRPGRWLLTGWGG